MRAGKGWVGPILKDLFDLQSRPGCSWTELWEEALPWTGSTRDTDSCCAALCRAVGLVTHRHELVIRNVSSHEEVSGSGLLHCVSSFVVLFVGLFEDRWLLHAELCLCASLALDQVCACMRVCFVFFLYLLSAQRLYPKKPWPRVSFVCAGDSVLYKLVWSSAGAVDLY